MVNTVTKQTILDGETQLIVKMHITGDGSGDETATNLIDVSTYAGAPTEVKIYNIDAAFSGFSVNMLWDATANVDIINLPEGEDIFDFERFGGLLNNSGTGKTGDIVFTTSGLGSGDEGTIILHMRKD